MQQRTLLVLVLLAAPAAASSISARSAAQAWLQSHKSPTEDQLGELQKSNPAAFALVNSLLSKHAKHVASLTPDEMGPDVFRRMMTPAHLSAARPRAELPYGESMSLGMSQPAVIDQAHYDPQAQSDKDDRMVDKLLGAVAGLAGKRGAKIALLRQRRHKNKEREDPFAKDRDLFGMDDEPPAKPQHATELVSQVSKEMVAEPPKKHENSYMKDIDLSGDMPKVMRLNQARKEVSEGADLASFSFDDSVPAATPAPKPVAPKKKDNAFLKWLGIVKKAPAPQEQPAAPVQKAPKQNSYLADFMA